MNRYILALFLVLLAFPVAAQLQFKERVEIPAESFEPIFELMRIPSGLLAFRTFQPRSLNAALVFEYYLTSDLLQSDSIKEVKIKAGFDMIGYDIDEDQLYVLFAKGDDDAADKYVLHLDLNTQKGVEYAADNLLPMDLVEFLVLDKKAIFM
ncbi:MAG: hypothetical protein O2829_11155, partial [Bacteroidetes bacterium]|nr:hypothetical protein [Bacteroidota bacterium]